MLTFKIDENLPVEVAEFLQQAGYDAKTVRDQDLQGASDANIALVCQQERRAIITLNVGFADIRTYPPQQYAGLIVLRLQRHDKPHVLSVLARIVPKFENEPLEQHLWIVDENRIRIRG